MSVFDEPIKAHRGHPPEPVMWLGTDRFVVGNVEMPRALIIDKEGRPRFVDIETLTADWRWVENVAQYIDGDDGPGWVALELLEKPKEPRDEAVAAVVNALTGDPIIQKTPEGQDYIIAADGSRWDPKTNLPLDD